MSRPENELYYADLGERGLLIFLGEEPHLNEDVYSDAFFDLAEATGVKRIVAIGGVYGAMPYDKDREISCVYSLPRMKAGLEQYTVRFSNYEGGTTIGTYLAHKAEEREMELVVFYGMSPAYEFSQLGITLQSMRVEEDYKAWYDIMRRIDHMFGTGLNLSDLGTRALELVDAWDEKIEELEKAKPDLHIHTYLERIADEFEERAFIPLDDAWNELGDLLDGMDESE